MNPETAIVVMAESTAALVPEAEQPTLLDIFMLLKEIQASVKKMDGKIESLEEEIKEMQDGLKEVFKDVDKRVDKVEKKVDKIGHPMNPFLNGPESEESDYGPPLILSCLFFLL
ncbi:OLC1v1012684C1 [Oldenlandia corymbosa var. corymbosa]|uniref:OLC1v1012684C1 n=1 Tax=Oldenlandia corymbosa var. corymbosa TaxID=529605 RepID=A0AAV1DX55_OLDCO|nr:OLC1v1012684C1 [Oldenlandia corymbosa var. corymbosa]